MTGQGAGTAELKATSCEMTRPVALVRHGQPVFLAPGDTLPAWVDETTMAQMLEAGALHVFGRL